MKVLVTGARGFIGSNFVRMIADDERFENVIAFCRDTNDSSRQRLDAVRGNRSVSIVRGDLCNDLSGLCEGVDVVFNFAAKTFVDHSIRDPMPFIRTNVVGTQRLIEDARKHKVKAFFQVSTDEVYGQILEGAHHEGSPLCPRNPYAASKAAADAIVQSYAHTFGMFTCITRTENNYGPWQHSQKAMPRFIACALDDKPLPVYGDGLHVRQWLHVDDHCQAIIQLCVDGWQQRKVESGEVFHVAGKQELTNIELAHRLLSLLGKPKDQIEFIDDHDIRPGHDRRYALSCDKIADAIGWRPAVGLDDGLSRSVEWYRSHGRWLRS